MLGSAILPGVRFVAPFFVGSSIAIVAACGSNPRAELIVHYDAGTDAGTDAEGESDTGFLGDASPYLGGPCVDDAQCNDQIACTYDSCDTAVGRCLNVPDSTQCQDGIYCDGQEQCVPGHGCEPGAVVSCDNGNACQIATCVEATKSCAYTERDVDQDGDPDAHCEPGHDCDDLESRRLEPARRGVRQRRSTTTATASSTSTPCVTPQGDTCGDAVAVAGAGTYALSTLGANDTFATSCSVTNPSAGQNVVAAITVPPGQNVDLEVWASTTGTRCRRGHRRGVRRSDDRACLRVGADGDGRPRTRLATSRPGPTSPSSRRSRPTAVELAGRSAPSDVARRRTWTARAPRRCSPAPRRRSRSSNPPTDAADRLPCDHRRAHLLVHADADAGRAASTRRRCKGAGRRSSVCATPTASARPTSWNADWPGPLPSTSGASRRARTSSPWRRRPRIDATLRGPALAAHRRPARPDVRVPARRHRPTRRSTFDLSDHENAIKDGCVEERAGRGLRSDADLGVGRAPRRPFPRDRGRRRVARRAGLRRRRPRWDVHRATPRCALGKRNVAAGDYRVVVADQLGFQGTLRGPRPPDRCADDHPAGRRRHLRARPSTRRAAASSRATRPPSNADYDERCDAPGEPPGGAPDQVLALNLAQAAARGARHGGLGLYDAALA